MSGPHTPSEIPGETPRTLGRHVMRFLGVCFLAIGALALAVDTPARSAAATFLGLAWLVGSWLIAAPGRHHTT